MHSTVAEDVDCIAVVNEIMWTSCTRQPNGQSMQRFRTCSDKIEIKSPSTSWFCFTSPQHQSLNVIVAHRDWFNNLFKYNSRTKTQEFLHFIWWSYITGTCEATNPAGDCYENSQFHQYTARNVVVSAQRDSQPRTSNKTSSSHCHTPSRFDEYFCSISLLAMKKWNSSLYHTQQLKGLFTTTWPVLGSLEVQDEK